MGAVLLIILTGSSVGYNVRDCLSAIGAFVSFLSLPLQVILLLFQSPIVLTYCLGYPRIPCLYLQPDCPPQTLAFHTSRRKLGHRSSAQSVFDRLGGVWARCCLRTLQLV